jgi:hypothetical protein
MQDVTCFRNEDLYILNTAFWREYLVMGAEVELYFSVVPQHVNVLLLLLLVLISY